LSDKTSKKMIEGPPDLEILLQQYKKTGSPEDKEKLVIQGKGLANYFAGIYSPGRVDENLKQAAVEGFHTALNRYDHSSEIPFTKYATHCIITEVRNELRAKQLFKVPEWLKHIQNDIINATEELARKNYAVPTLEDIANKVNIAENGITETMQAGSISLDEINLSSIKSTRYEAFKLPIEDVITIRKSLDRLSDIQKKVLSLISVNIRELSLAIEEEEQALVKAQAKHMRIVEDSSSLRDNQESLDDFKVKFPDEYLEEEVTRYFEVLSDKFSLRLSDIIFKSRSLNHKGDNNLVIPLQITLEGRYRGLLQLLDYLRNEEKAIRVARVQATRNENIPARVIVSIVLNTYYAKI